MQQCRKTLRAWEKKRKGAPKRTLYCRLPLGGKANLLHGPICLGRRFFGGFPNRSRCIFAEILTRGHHHIVFKTQTGAAFIAFWAFVALFAVAYRWALRRGGQAANRTSRKFEKS